MQVPIILCLCCCCCCFCILGFCHGFCNCLQAILCNLDIPICTRLISAKLSWIYSVKFFLSFFLFQILVYIRSSKWIVINRGVVLSDEECLRVIYRLSLACHEKHIPWSAQNRRHQNLLIN